MRNSSRAPVSAAADATAAASGTSVASISPASRRSISASVRPCPCSSRIRASRSRCSGPYQATRPSRGRRQQPPLLVEANRVDRHLGPPGQVLDTPPLHGSDCRSNHSHNLPRRSESSHIAMSRVAPPWRWADHDIRCRRNPAQVLFQTGWRFSAKAVAPSIASPLAKASLASSFVRCQPAASSSSAASRTS